MTVAPTSLIAGSGANTLAFRYTAAGVAIQGTVKFVVPTGWTTPQTTQPSAPGYLSAGGCNQGGPTIAGTGPWTVSVAINCPKANVMDVFYAVTSPTVAGSTTFSASSAAGSAPALPLKSSPKLTVKPGAAAMLVFATQPSVTPAGSSISPAPAVEVDDAFGNRTNSAAAVTIALGAHPASSSLVGTTKVSAISGLATFPGLSITKASPGYTLKATSGHLTAATSTAFTVAAGPVATMSVSPGSATLPAGGSQAYAAEGFDRFGNDAGDVSGATTFSLAPDGSCTGATCSATVPGGHTVSAVDGAAHASAQLSVVPGPVASLSVAPGSATIAAGGSQRYAAEGFDRFGNDTGDVTGATTFSLAPDGSCVGPTCSATVAGEHTVSAVDGAAHGSAQLSVVAADVADVHVTLSPGQLTANGYSTATATAIASDAYGNHRNADQVSFSTSGDVTFGPVSNNGDGTYATVITSSRTAGQETITATDGTTTGQAILTEAAPTFAATGSLPSGREQHSAVLLANGKVLVAGGSSGATDEMCGTPHAATDLYDPTTQAWSSTGSMSSGRLGVALIRLQDGRVLAAGGFANPDCQQSQVTAELYDPTSGTWSAAGSMQVPRSDAAATLLPSGKVLVAGGVVDDSGNSTASAELYDPATDTWTLTDSMHAIRRGFSATVLGDGRVLVEGGRDGCCTFQSSAETFDPATGLWTLVGSLAVPRYRQTAILLADGRVLVAGSYNGSFTATAEVFDPQTNIWSTTGSMTVARYDHKAVLLPDGRVLVLGGENGDGPISAAELYDPSTGVWTATASMTAGRAGPTATLLPDGSVLVAGGYNGTGTSITSSELYE